jgi:RND family efflux transporter MFP subunit
MALLAAVLVTACPSRKEPGASTRSTPNATRDVKVVVPLRRYLERAMHVPGSVSAYFQATLFAQVAGYVKAVNFDKGDPLRSDEIIAEIDVPELLAARGTRAARIDQMRAHLERAKANAKAAIAREREARADVARAQAMADLQVAIHERAKALRASGDISVQDLEVAAGNAGAAVAEGSLAAAKRDTASAEIAGANADVSLAQANLEGAEHDLEEIEATLEYARVRAPFDGIVTARFLDPGALVQRATRTEQAQPVVTVATRGRVRIDFELPQDEVAFVHSGSRIELTSSAYQGRAFGGTVTRVASALHPETRTELCEAEFSNEDDALLPGMYVTLRVVLEQHSGAVIVPPDAIVERSGETFAFVVEDETVRKQPIKKGWDFGTFVEVSEGISTRDRVVLSGGDLRDRQRVTAHRSPWISDEERRGTDRGKNAERESP